MAYYLHTITPISFNAPRALKPAAVGNGSAFAWRDTR